MLVKKFRKSIFFSKVDRFIMRILEKTLNRKGYRLWRQCALSGYINLYNPSFVEFFTAALKTLTFSQNICIINKVKENNAIFTKNAVK